MLVVITASCNNKNINDLKLHSDKLEDVKEKFGQADSIAKVSLFGNTSELWVYKEDSISLVFVNDILTKIRTPESERLEYFKIEKEAKAKMDSLFSVASKELKAP